MGFVCYFFCSCSKTEPSWPSDASRCTVHCAVDCCDSKSGSNSKFLEACCWHLVSFCLTQTVRALFCSRIFSGATILWNPKMTGLQTLQSSMKDFIRDSMGGMRLWKLLLYLFMLAVAFRSNDLVLIVYKLANKMILFQFQCRACIHKQSQNFFCVC